MCLDTSHAVNNTFTVFVNLNITLINAVELYTLSININEFNFIVKYYPIFFFNNYILHETEVAICLLYCDLSE